MSSTKRFVMSIGSAVIFRLCDVRQKVQRKTGPKKRRVLFSRPSQWRFFVCWCIVCSHRGKEACNKLQGCLISFLIVPQEEKKRRQASLESVSVLDICQGYH